MDLESQIRRLSPGEEVYKIGEQQLYRHDVSMFIDLLQERIGTPAQRNAVIRVMNQLRGPRRKYGMADKLTVILSEPARASDTFTVPTRAT